MLKELATLARLKGLHVDDIMLNTIVPKIVITREDGKSFSFLEEFGEITAAECLDNEQGHGSIIPIEDISAARVFLDIALLSINEEQLRIALTVAVNQAADESDIFDEDVQWRIKMHIARSLREVIKRRTDPNAPVSLGMRTFMGD